MCVKIEKATKEFIGKMQWFSELSELLEKDFGHQYAKEFVWIIAGIVGVLSDDMSLGQKPFSQMFGELLRHGNIKHVAEVGPCGHESSVIGPLADLFRQSGCKLSVIQRDFDRASQEFFNANRIEMIKEKAGNLPKENFQFDLIIASNVFSIGGNCPGYFVIRYEDSILNANNGVSDLVSHLSGNPKASVILTELYDVLLTDRDRFAQGAEIVCWEPWNTSYRSCFCNSGDFAILPDAISRVLSQSANFIVLQKKQPLL
jgi:hypothetical protein